VCGGWWLLGPLLAVQVGMGESILILAFVVIVIGGHRLNSGCVAGGIAGRRGGHGGSGLDSAAICCVVWCRVRRQCWPALASILIYVLMAAVCCFSRPQGLFPAHG
jgi:branched-chain amino acid transport system permease protein